MEVTDILPLAYHTCHRFCQQHGGNIEDLLSVTHEATVLALNSFDKSRGKLPSHVTSRVWYALMEHHKRERIRHHKRLPQYIPAGNNFDLSQFLSEVSSDAREVISLLLELPTPPIARKDRHKGRQGVMMEQLASLLREAGWAGGRVLESFEEIREALS